MNTRLALFLFAFLSACSEKKPSSPTPAPVYQTLHRPDFPGAIFQFEHQGDHYLACSIHQGGLAPGAKLFRVGQSDPVIVGKRIHKQKDLHVWSFDKPSPEPSHLLKYTPNPSVELNDRIYFLNKGQKIAATVVALPKGDQFRHTYKTDRPFAPNGLSGSPVYHPSTGAVIGVLQTANDKKQATFGGFELLKLN